MKAILVIDMPSNCLDCPCEYDYLTCKAIDHRLDYVDADNERPSWCPLRSIPSKAAEDLIKGLDAMEKMIPLEVWTIRRTE